jgi:hypothetical protein
MECCSAHGRGRGSATSAPAGAPSGCQLAGACVPQPGPAGVQRCGLSVYLGGESARRRATGLGQGTGRQRPDPLGAGTHGGHLNTYLLVAAAAIHRSQHEPAIGVAAQAVQLPAQRGKITHWCARGHRSGHRVFGCDRRPSERAPFIPDRPPGTISPRPARRSPQPQLAGLHSRAADHRGPSQPRSRGHPCRSHRPQVAPHPPYRPHHPPGRYASGGQHHRHGNPGEGNDLFHADRLDHPGRGRPRLARIPRHLEILVSG